MKFDVSSTRTLRQKDLREISSYVWTNVITYAEFHDTSSSTKNVALNVYNHFSLQIKFIKTAEAYTEPH